MPQCVTKGIVPAGAYPSLTVTGPVRFEEGVSFGTLTVTGTLRAPSLKGDMILCSGSIDCEGTLHAKRIEGHGTLRIGGDLEVEALDFAGDVVCAGDMRCETTIALDGSLTEWREVAADCLQVNGVVRAASLDSRLLQLAPLDSTMFGRFDMERYRKESQVDQVRARTVEAGALRCARIDAGSVTLTRGSRVEHVRCDDTLTLDRSSSVLLIEGPARRVHLKSA